ncbi:MAG: hypothetical protein ACKVZJ_09670 [Phycisphaerales bacterium]
MPYFGGNPSVHASSLVAAASALLLCGAVGCSAGGGVEGGGGTSTPGPTRAAGAADRADAPRAQSAGPVASPPARAGGADSGAAASSGVLAESVLSRVYLAQGRAAVLPLIPPEGLPEAARASWVPSGSPRILLENGAELSSTVWGIVASPPVDRLAPTRWLAPGPAWSAFRLGEADVGAASGRVRWVAVVEAPTGIPERRLPSFARVDDRVIELGWLPPARQNPDVAKAARPQVSPESLRELGEMLRSEAADPQRRWRVRLIEERFTPSALWGDAGIPPGFGGVASQLAPPLEATAEQLELNARSALDNLRRHDAALALDVLNRMTAVVRSPEGVLLPAWPSGNEGVGALLEVLLAPAAQGVDVGAVRAEAARRWLNETPAAQAWIIDDIGVRSSVEGAARFEPSVGVADLTGKGGRAWATSSSAYSGQELEVALQPVQMAALRMKMPLPEKSLAAPRGGDAAPVIEAGLDQSGGRESVASADATLQPIFGVAPIRPPGFVMGPLLEPWTMASWRARRPVATGTVRGGSVTIQRAVSSEGGGGGGAWEMVVRCGPAVGASRGEDDQTDVVRMWCGPFNKARGMVQVSRERGGAEWVRKPGERGTRLMSRELPLSAAEPAGSWAMLVTLPKEAFEEDGVLVVGLERESPRGVRTSFPRPMMPGQAEPGRVALDPGAWGGLNGR